MLSVVIVNFKTRDLLLKCLRSLQQQVYIYTSCLEIIVIDNASHDGSAEAVAREFPQVKLIVNRTNLGYAKANNQGIQLARGDYILLLNPDTEVPPLALQGLVGFLKAHPEAGAVAPKLVYPDGRLQLSCRSFPRPTFLLFSALGLERLFPNSRLFGGYKMSWWDYGSVREVEQPMASCLLLRRVALQQVGVLDERFPIFFNDVDLCWRLHQAGWKIYFLPDVQVVHHHGASTRFMGAELVRESHDSLLRFYRKHYKSVLHPLVYWGACELIAVGGIIRSVWAKITKRRWNL